MCRRARPRSRACARVLRSLDDRLLAPACLLARVERCALYCSISARAHVARQAQGDQSFLLQSDYDEHMYFFDSGQHH